MLRPAEARARHYRYQQDKTMANRKVEKFFHEQSQTDIARSSFRTLQEDVYSINCILHICVLYIKWGNNYVVLFCYFIMVEHNGYITKYIW